MKIWLINPPTLRHQFDGESSVVRNLFYNSPPLGLAYMAAVLERQGHTVTITDAPLEGATPDRLVAIAKALRPDLVGITATTPYYDMAVLTARTVKKTLESVPIGIGGSHMNANPDLLLNDGVFDFGVMGEGEMTLKEIAGRVLAGKTYDDVPGVVTAKGDTLQFAPHRSLVEDLDALPFPARHLLPLHAYIPMPNDQHRLPKTSMVSSRGCPFHCSFCDKSTFGDRYRSASPKRIVQEVHHLESLFGIRDIAFVDSTFTPAKRRVHRVLDAMEADPPRATWTCSCRANVLDEHLLMRMRAMNCWRIRIAIESGNQQILETICKGITKQDIATTAGIAHRLGFKIKCFFMVGHIGETEQTITESIAFARRLPLTDITVQINTPLKGTAQYEQCKKHGTLLEEDESKSTFFQPVFVPKDLTAQKLIDAQRRFYRKFYLRPVIFWRHLKSIRRPADVAKYLRAWPLVRELLFRRRP